MSGKMCRRADGPVTDADREALIERLLLAGLDQYFEGRYEQAVDVWTRVAFLERGHGRARAYIERARVAMAERQRQAEEMLHRGIEAYHAGELSRARDLLTRAVAEGGASDTALVFLQRLGRVDAPEPGAVAGPAPVAPHRGSGRHRRAAAERRLIRRSTNWVATILVSAVVAGSILLIAQPIASWLGDLPIAAPTAATAEDDALPIVRASEMQLARARDLYESGRLRDALRLLDEITLADPLRADADRLTAEIQRELLATAPAAEGTGR